VWASRILLRLINELRFKLHDLWPDRELPVKVQIHPGWQTEVQACLARAQQTTQVRFAKDMIRRVSELTRAAKDVRDRCRSVTSLGAIRAPRTVRSGPEALVAGPLEGGRS
jgi:hypothetical protein